MAHGHPDPFEYSIDKILTLFELAQRRIARDHAREDLRMLRVVRTAICSIDARGLGGYKQLEKILMEAANLERPSSERLAKRLLKGEIRANTE